MASENLEQTIKDLQALLAFLRTIGYDTSTITLPAGATIVTRLKEVIDEELNV